MSKDVMSKIRGGDVWREFQKVFREYRIDEARDVTVTDRRPHPALSVTYCGLTRTMNFAGTPGSRFTCKASASDLRKMLKEMQLAAVSMPVALAPAPMERPAVKAITFRGVEIDTMMHDGEPHVALKPIVEGMGLDWEPQRQRVQRDSVLGSSTSMMLVVASDGKLRETVSIPLKMLNGFLFGIDDSRVRSDLREGIIAYKRECYDALARYWLHGIAVRQEVVPAPPEPIYEAGLSRDALHAIGGVIKSVVTKQVVDALVEFRSEMVGLLSEQRRLSGDQTIVRNYLSSQAVIVELAGVPKDLRYHGLSAWVSLNLSRYCASADLVPLKIETYPGEKLTFPRQAAEDWLARGGRAEIWRRCLAKKPQGIGPLFDRGAA